MTNKIKSLIIVFALANATFGIAQTNDSTVHRSVDVSREFKPVINDAGKIISSPKIVEPTVIKSSPIYSNITTPLTVEHNIHLLKAQELLNRMPDAKKGFFRMGLGYPINTLGDFMYPIWSNDKNRLDVSVNHLGAFGDKKHSKTAASLKYNHLFNSFDFYTGVSGQHDFFNYYGSSFAGLTPVIMSEVAAKYGQNAFYIAPPKSDIMSLHTISGFAPDDSHWRFHANVGARSLPLASNLIFDAGLNFDGFKAVGSNLIENQILIDAMFNVPFNKNRLGIDFEAYNFTYNKELSPDFSSKDQYSVLKINPFWRIEGEKWFLRLGVKTGISIGQWQTFTPSPDVAFQWNALPNYFAIFGGATGDLTVNSLNRIYNENRYVSSNIRIEDTYTPIDAYIGIKLSPAYNLMFDFYGQYKIIDNQYFYINKYYSAVSLPTIQDGLNFMDFYHNRFDVIYSKANRASLGMRAKWDFKNRLNLYLKGAYHRWDVETEAQAWHLPTWEADFGANVKITNDITATTQFIFQDGRYTKLSNQYGTKLNPVLDWNLAASYAYRDWLSVFAKLNNILNKKYEIYGGYDVQGINIMVGAAFSF